MHLAIYNFQITPSTVLEINFKQLKCQRKEDTSPLTVPKIPLLNADHERRLFSELQTHIPDAVVLSSVIPVTVSKKQVFQKLPFLLTSLERCENLLSKSELRELSLTTLINYL